MPPGYIPSNCTTTNTFNATVSVYYPVTSTVECTNVQNFDPVFSYLAWGTFFMLLIGLFATITTLWYLSVSKSGMWKQSYTLRKK